MNTSRLVGHVAGSVVFTALWEAAISLPAGSPGWRLIALGALPQAVALASVGLQELADASGGRPGEPGQKVADTTRRQVPVARREITRPPARPALTGRR